MKNLSLLISLLILLSVNYCLAQDNDFSKPIVHGSKQTYNVSESYLHHKLITNTNNHFYNKSKDAETPANPIPPRNKDVHYDKAIITQIIYNTFTDVRIKKLADEDLNMYIGFGVDDKGNVLETSFSFADNSSLTPREIEKLENQLKDKVKFILNDKVFKGQSYIFLHTFVNFKKLADHEPNAVFP